MNKDTEIYKAVIKAQNGNNSDIANVIYLLFKDKLICKYVGKQIVWYEKVNDTEYSLVHEIKVRKLVFKVAKQVFNQTAQFLYTNAFSDEYDLHKPQYLYIANLIMKATNHFSIRASKNNLMKELQELLIV